MSTSSPIHPTIQSESRWYNAAVTPKTTRAQWEAYLSKHKSPHLLQSRAWGDLKSDFGWKVEYIQSGEAGAQILFRRFPLGYSLAYIPKGPLGEWLPGILPELDAVCKKQRCFAVKIEPDEDSNTARMNELLEQDLIASPHTVQPKTTLIVDLTSDEDRLLAAMHPKTRYNIRLATRKGVKVKPWEDLDSFGRMMKETADRDGFGTHTPSYYQRAYELFHPDGSCELLMAEYEGIPLAALMVFAHGTRAWYLYGASINLERNRMPTYLLQWEAMKWAKGKGCVIYDLWGIPDESQKNLESEFTSRKDGLWGVYRFKRGFGGEVVHSIGAWDRVYIPSIYRLYRWSYSLLRV
jgi:peptidoglycan pentaglycine glycine transferase (the first glycine)